MRILHTADWHLGKMFYGEYLTDEQEYVLKNQFLPMLADEKIEAVVLAGDVYDRSLPPADAVDLFDEIATKITVEMGIPFILVSGNHDSAARLSFGSRLLSRQHMYIAGEPTKLEGPVMLRDQWGDVAVVPVPFSEPAVVRHFLDNGTVSDHQAALANMIAWQSQGIPDGVRRVCVAHAFVTGCTASESERPLSLGGTDQVESSVFEGFSYTALGHLHGPQQAGSDSIRYSGSLLKYSFGEATQKKGVVIVEIEGNGAVETTFSPLVPRRDVRIVKGTFEDVMAADDQHIDDYVLARLTDTRPVLDGMAKLRRKYPHALALEMPNRLLDEKTGSRNLDLHHTTDEQLFNSFVEEMRSDQALSDEEKTCIDTVWKALAVEEGGHS